MSDRHYTSIQALAVHVDDFLEKLFRVYGPSSEYVEKELRRQARAYHSPCYGSRMKVKMANLLRTNRKERDRKERFRVD